MNPALARRELTGDELTDVRSLWNSELAHLSGDELKARGFALTTAPGQAHLSWPAGPSHPGQHALLTLVSLDGRWSPRPAVNPEAVAATLEVLDAAFRDVERQARDGRADRTDIALGAWHGHNQADVAASIIRAGQDELLEIPDNVEIAACAAVFVPAESDGTASA